MMKKGVYVKWLKEGRGYYVLGVTVNICLIGIKRD